MGSTLMIRDVDDDVKARLRVQAARNGRSMAAEARAILEAAVFAHPGLSLYEAFRHSADAADIELEIPPRVVEARPPFEFD
jgi:plasmid stability protein